LSICALILSEPEATVARASICDPQGVGLVDKKERRPIFMPLAAFFAIFAALSRSSTFATIRAYDGVMIFAAGMCVGVALRALLAPRTR
jgi:hypothetical protein